jgi:hypothetical protein
MFLKFSLAVISALGVLTGSDLKWNADTIGFANGTPEEVVSNQWSVVSG